MVVIIIVVVIIISIIVGSHQCKGNNVVHNLKAILKVLDSWARLLMEMHRLDTQSIRHVDQSERLSMCSTYSCNKHLQDNFNQLNRL